MHLLEHISHKPPWFRCFFYHRKDESLKSGNSQAVIHFSQQISSGHGQLSFHFYFWGGRLKPSTACMKPWFCQPLEDGQVQDSSTDPNSIGHHLQHLLCQYIQWCRQNTAQCFARGSSAVPGVELLLGAHTIKIMPVAQSIIHGRH